MKKVVVGLSGGVDSSVAAYLLKKEGYDVIGLFMRNWNDASVTLEDDCPWIEDSKDAMLVAEKLDIPFQVVDLSEQYKERIVDYMFAEYKAGRTPNPDVLCNREIKFDIFMDIALNLGADYIATGHYCRKETIEKDDVEIHKLLAGVDQNKDQSYFLCQLNQKQLAKALFPVGHLQKPEVREIAKKLDLITANKKDSQGLCFIGKVKLPEFLQQQLAPKKGEVIEIPKTHFAYHQELIEGDDKHVYLMALATSPTYSKTDGKVVGNHNGAHYFTKGQRKGLAIGGTKEPLFVIDTDVKENLIYTGQGKSHSGLYKKALYIKKEEVNWIRKDKALNNNETVVVSARIRYRQPLQKATIYAFEDGLYIEFEQPQSAITEGQFAAWYLEDELIGSGVISH